MIFRIVLLLSLLLSSAYAVGRVDVGQYNNPRDLTLKIQDPFAQENPDLMQPVIGDYLIKVLPPHVDFNNEAGPYLSEGLYFKQIGKTIYIDIRQPPKQKNAGSFDLAVSLTVPGEDPVSNRLPRHLIYTDSATDVLLVIDNSRSMMKNDPRRLRYAACKNFIHLSSLSDKIDNIGVIKFSGSAKTVLPWTKPHEMEDKGAFRLFSRDRTGNFTNINDAFELASTMFEDSFAREKVLVLLTDGKNEPDRYRDTHDLLIEQGVRVYTVGLSKEADGETLQQIAKETGGDFFEAVDDKKLLQIYNQIAQELNEFKLISQGVSEEGEVSFDMTKYDDFVDVNIFSYPADSSFTLNDSTGNDIDFRLIKGTDEDNATILRVPNPNPGNYKLKIKSKTPNAQFNYDLHTNSKLFLKLFPLEKKYIKGEIVHFAASIAHRQVPMINADMKLTIRNIEGAVVRELTMYDDGVHGDNHAGDGVYCAINPLDLKEGQYNIEVSVSGKTPDGDNFVRVEKESFSVLEAGGEIQDYFLASVLPLYIDFGKLEQGQSGKANLRLSFEGRGNREITMFPGEDVIPSQGDAKGIPWNKFEFPKVIELAPSDPVILSLKIDVPQGLAPGKYNGSVIVQMGDQQLAIPIDLDVKLTTLTKQNIVKAERVSMPRELESLVKKEDSVKGLEPLAMIGGFDPKKEKLTIPKTKKSVEFKDLKPPEPKPVVMTPEVKEVIKLEPIKFTVSPEEVDSFEVEVGQYASCLFKITNLSNYSGNVQIRLDGFGDIDRQIVELDAEGSFDLTWYWDIAELTETPQPIRLTIFNESGEIVRKLSWAPKPIVLPLAFYITIAGLALIALIYAIKYLLSLESGHGFVSASALAHLILVIVAFYYFFPEEIKPEPEPEVLAMDFLPEPEPVIEEQPIEKVEKVSPEPIPMKEVKPVPKPKPRELPMVKQEVNTLKRQEQAKKSMVETSVQEIELKKVERKVESTERVFDKTSKMVDSKPVVMSVNDRPQRRAVLTPKKVTPKLDQIKVQRSETAVFRERRVNTSRKELSPESITLKPMKRDVKAPDLNSPDAQFKAGEQPKLSIEQSKLKLEEELDKIKEMKVQGNVQQARDLAMEQRKSDVQTSKEQAELTKTTSTPQQEVKLPSNNQTKAKGGLISNLPKQEMTSTKVKAGALNLEETVEKVSVELKAKSHEKASKLDTPDRKVVDLSKDRERKQGKMLEVESSAPKATTLQSGVEASTSASERLQAFDPKQTSSANLKWAKLDSPQKVVVKDVDSKKIDKVKVEKRSVEKAPAPEKLMQRSVNTEISKVKPVKGIKETNQITRKDRPKNLNLTNLKRPSNRTSAMVKKNRSTSSQGQALPAPKPVRLQEIEQEKKVLESKLDDSLKGPSK